MLNFLFKCELFYIFIAAVQLASISQHSPLDTDRSKSSFIQAKIMTTITMIFILYTFNVNFCKV